MESKPKDILKIEKECGVNLDLSPRISKKTTTYGKELSFPADSVYIDENLKYGNRAELGNFYIVENELKENFYSLNEKDQIIKLSFSSFSSAIIESVSKLEHLEELSLSNCALENINGLQALKNLKNLNLSKNKINDITALFDLINLEVLNLYSNKINSLNGINKLKKLSKLNLGFNELNEEINLKSLKKLKNLSLSRNLIKTISNIKVSKNLEYIDLSNNEIKDLQGIENFKYANEILLNNNNINSIEFLKNDISLLFSINLDHNKIMEIPKEIFFYKFNLESIIKEKFLKLVKAAKNEAVKIQNYELAARTRDIEKQIENASQISEKNFNFINNLYQYTLLLKLNKNLLISPPIEVLNNGVEDVIKWYEQSDIYGTEPLYEAKLLIVGEPNTGKTSLRKKLLDSEYKIPNNEEAETLGVYVDSGYIFPYYKDNMKNISTHIWDFGGQEKQYPLHQYFLRDKSVYVLLSSDREDNEKLDKWFHIIKLLSGNENDIIVVLNQKNKSSQSINFNEEKYKRLGFKFKVYALDFSKDKERLLELQQDINKEISNLGHIGEQYPKYCKSIAEMIDKRRFDDGKDYLLYEEYEKICKELEITKPELLDNALQYLSIVGKVIHYSEDENLERIIIINPHWLIDAIYGIITCEELDEYHNKGIFTKEWLIDFLKKPTKNKPNGYSKSESLHILNLMLKNHFDICYNVGENYLTPLCMPSTLISNDFEESIIHQQLFFKYSVMPSGIVARLLVRLSDYIKDDLISKTGGVLKKERNLVKIEEYEFSNDGNKYIKISINGEKSTSKEFLDIIRYEIKNIHKDWFNNLNIVELIPCDCSKCKILTNPYLYEMESLQQRLGKNKYTVECNNSYEDINIFRLTGKLYDLPPNLQIESYEALVNLVLYSNINKDKLLNLLEIMKFNPKFIELTINHFNLGNDINITGDISNSQIGGQENTQTNIYDYSQEISNITQSIEKNSYKFSEESKLSLDNILYSLKNIESENIQSEKNKTILQKLSQQLQNFWKTIKNESEKKLAKTLVLNPIIGFLMDISDKIDVNELLQILKAFI